MNGWIGVFLLVVGIVIIFSPLAAVIARFARDHPRGLAIVLLTYFLVSLVLQAAFGWQNFVSEQQSHGQSAQVFGPDGYVWAFGDRVFENWQSEFLQLAAMVIIGSSLRYKGSSESKDSAEQSDRTEEKLDQVLVNQRDLTAAVKHLQSSYTARFGSGEK